MSIFPWFLLVGVACVGCVGVHGNDAVPQPIGVNSTQAHRICAALCSAGLGGDSCGESCLNKVPKELPTRQSAVNLRARYANGRHDACPILCENALGNPLCGCEKPTQKKELDLLGICKFFCLNYEYNIDGCPSCDALCSKAKIVNRRKHKVKIDWEEWCKSRCIEGDGGAACNCDILPLRMNL